MTLRKFKSVDSKKLRDGRTVFSVEADMEMSGDVYELINEWVNIDGIPKKVKGIERDAKGTNISKGEIIGLIV